MHNVQSLRELFELPADFPPAVTDAAANATDRFARDRVDARDVEFVTIDPPGSLDLDQAVCIQRTETGYRCNYAIADVGAFVAPGSPIDLEAKRRGQTIYLPDGNVPLHPRILSENKASLVAGEDRPAIWWQVETDASGSLTQVRVRRAIVHVRERLDYPTLQQQLDAGQPLHPAIALLPEWGHLREQQAHDAGAIELQLPEQDLELIDGEWQLRLEPRTQIDGWNAQCSIATGIAAAHIMLAANVGLLRTLPAPDADTIATFRKVARALSVTVTDDATPGTILDSLEPGSPESLALNAAATKLLRGAGYEAFDGAPPATAWHAGVAASYAHATAPLRRLADRHVNEICVAASAGAWVPLQHEPDNAPTLDATAVPASIRAELPELAGIMQASGKRASDVDNTAINLGEAVALQHRVGETFTAALLRPADGNHDAEIYVMTPPVIAQCAGDVPAGELVKVTLTVAEPAKQRVRFRYPAS